MRLRDSDILAWVRGQFFEGKIKGEMVVTRRRGRRRKLLDDLKNRREYSHLKEEALDRTVWRNRFGRGFGPVVRQNDEWMNERRGHRKMSQLLGAFGLLDSSRYSPILAWRAF
jgi:hypothetical protein